jgi:hypothetical protein
MSDDVKMIYVDRQKVGIEVGKGIRTDEARL